LQELILRAVIATLVAVTYGVMVLAISIRRTIARLLRMMASLHDDASLMQAWRGGKPKMAVPQPF